MNPTRMPVLFVGHGSPMAAFEDNAYTANWSQLGTRLPRPRAIVCISAHWYTHGTGVVVSSQPRTIHDFYGFPAELYAYHYRAPGAPQVARTIMELLKPISVIADEQWGFDHGSWTVLKHMYPDASVPVLQVSMDGTQPASWHYQMGQRLRALRDQGVLIMGSGNVVHNLRYLQRVDAATPHPLAKQFNEHITQALLKRDDASVIDYERLGDAARFAAPSADHYLPLLYVLGASDADELPTLMTNEIALGSVSMMSAAFGLEAAHA